MLTALKLQEKRRWKAESRRLLLAGLRDPKPLTFRDTPARIAFIDALTSRPVHSVPKMAIQPIEETKIIHKPLGLWAKFKRFFFGS